MRCVEALGLLGEKELGVWRGHSVQEERKGHGRGLKGACESWLPPDCLILA